MCPICPEIGVKPSTLSGRSALKAHLLPAFGAQPLESITPEQVDSWRRGLTGLSNRSKNKLLIQLHGIFRRAQMVWGLQLNPLARVEKHPMRASGDIQVFSPEEVWALVRAAGSEQDGAIFLTAAFTGLRVGELLALRWRAVDFAGATIRVRASYYLGQLTTPKSGKVRTVPMAPDVAGTLAELGRRENWVGDEDLGFAGELGGYLDGSALRRRYEEALSRVGLRPLAQPSGITTARPRSWPASGPSWIGAVSVRSPRSLVSQRSSPASIGAGISATGPQAGGLSPGWGRAGS